MRLTTDELREQLRRHRPATILDLEGGGQPIPWCGETLFEREQLEDWAAVARDEATSAAVAEHFKGDREVCLLPLRLTWLAHRVGKSNAMNEAVLQAFVAGMTWGRIDSSPRIYHADRRERRRVERHQLGGAKRRGHRNVPDARIKQTVADLQRQNPKWKRMAVYSEAANLLHVSKRTVRRRAGVAPGAPISM